MVGGFPRGGSAPVARGCGGAFNRRPRAPIGRGPPSSRGAIRSVRRAARCRLYGHSTGRSHHREFCPWYWEHHDRNQRCALGGRDAGGARPDAATAALGLRLNKDCTFTKNRVEARKQSHQASGGTSPDVSGLKTDLPPTKGPQR